MKRALYALIAVATIGIATLNVSCKKEATDEFEVPSDSILIEMNMPLGAEGTTSFVSHNIASISAVSEPKGWEVTKIDMYRKEITVRSPKSFDDGEVKSGNITLTGYTALGADTSVTIYVAILENEDIDYSNAPANCYIANKPATRFLFNPYRGGGNGEVELNTDHIELIWESTEELINFIDMRDGKASLYLQPIKDDNGEFTDKVVTGNALIGAYDANDKLIWSWHIWVTNSDPTTDTIDLNGKALMNINLGADCNSEGDHERVGDSYGMYYQWGRRTPIVGPNTWNFALNEDKLTYNSDGLIVRLQYTESTADSGTAKWAEDNPTTMIVGNKDNAYDWLYEGHDELWSATEKSEHDPCPAGWRVPDSSIYEGLTISSVDDAMAWQEAQKMYGWHLVDAAGGSFFFTAQGRRNYLDGHLDIVNDDATRPIPWSGYYWTATTTDDGRASAMFFDLNSATRTWNGFEASRAMYRANALPIRCVRE
ncbi:MAG: hypothetical protein IKB15_07175 [Alistipes sp.]|nr:hypothetical protein [Alistipes sp.]